MAHFACQQCVNKRPDVARVTHTDSGTPLSELYIAGNGCCFCGRHGGAVAFIKTAEGAMCPAATGRL